MDWSFCNLATISWLDRVELGSPKDAISFWRLGGEELDEVGFDGEVGLELVVIWVGTTDLVLCGRQKLKRRDKGG